VSRFRLRFLLQEFDLPVGEVVLGRSPDCHITIEDPLISRRHAKILVTATGATYVDLGSRNGSRVNGKFVQGTIPLNDADRIRLGAQELVFFQVGVERRTTRQTGAMLFCRKCATPFPEGAQVCPHCGTPPNSPPGEDETISGMVLEPRRTWMLQLMGEVLERALTTKKVSEAERILQRAADEFTERVAAGDPLDTRQLVQIAEYAIRLALLQNESRWVKWVTDTFQTVERLPTPGVIDRLTAARDLPGVPAMVAEVVEQWREHQGTLSADEIASLSRLDALVRATAAS
jgi:hypothetical protein